MNFSGGFLALPSKDLLPPPLRKFATVCYSREKQELMVPASQSDHARHVSFGPFTVDLRAGELYKGKKKIKVQQLPLQVLGALLENPGEVVAREELKSRLWPADTFVDFEHGLNTAIKKLRQALGDNSEKPKYIETLPKKGYRFTGSIAGAAEKTAAKHSKGAAITGRVFHVCAEHDIECVIAPANESARAEWERLVALNDDVGISMMIADSRLLLIEVGQPVRVLSADGREGWCELRVLEGEHYGKTALLPQKLLRE